MQELSVAAETVLEMAIAEPERFDHRLAVTELEDAGLILCGVEYDVSDSKRQVGSWVWEPTDAGRAWLAGRGL